MDFSVVFEELMGSILPEWHSCLFVPFVVKKQVLGKHYLRAPKTISMISTTMFNIVATMIYIIFTKIG